MFPVLSPDPVVRLELLSPTDLAPLRIPGLHESTGGNPGFVAEAVSNGNRTVLSPTLSDALLGQCRAAGAYAHRVLLGHLPGVEMAYDLFPQPGDRLWTPADWAWIGGLLEEITPNPQQRWQAAIKGGAEREPGRRAHSPRKGQHRIPCAFAPV